MKRIEVIPDDEAEVSWVCGLVTINPTEHLISSRSLKVRRALPSSNSGVLTVHPAARRMTEKYDFVVTSVSPELPNVQQI